MPNFHDTLWNLTVDDLKMRIRLLSITSKPTVKADCINSIKAALEGPKLIRAWQALNETEKLAVAEAVHDTNHQHHPEVFSAKYQREAEFYQKNTNENDYISSSSRACATQLHVFFYREPYINHLFIPSDLAERLRPLVPQPSAPAVPCIAEPIADHLQTVRYTEFDALSELGALLQLAECGNLRYGQTTGIPSKAALNPILALFPSGDWFPPEIAQNPHKSSWQQDIGPIKPVGWTRLLLAAGLITMNGQKSSLTSNGRKAIGKPAWETILEIWRKWLSNKTFDEFNRIDVIKGQTIRGALTPKVPRRDTVIETLLDCPHGQWVSFDEFSRYMRASGQMFEVTKDAFKLYISDRQYGALGYSGYGGWDVLQDRYLLCFLMEYAATLGLIDIAFTHPDQSQRRVDNWGMDDYAWLSRYDGLLAFRINALGEYCLSDGKIAFQPTRVETKARLNVFKNRTISVESGLLSPAERMQIEIWAVPLSETVFCVDASRSLDAVQAGHDPAQFAEFLCQGSGHPLPTTMEIFLTQVSENGGAIRQCGAAVIFDCRDSHTADLLVNRKELSKFCHRAGETILAVREEGLAAFRKHARALNLGIR